MNYSKNNNNVFTEILNFVNNLTVFTSDPHTKPLPILESVGLTLAQNVISLFNTKQIPDDEKWHIERQQQS